MRKSIIIRDGHCKEIIKEENELIKNRKYQNLTKHRNQQQKQQHYNKYFEAKKKQVQNPMDWHH